MWVHDEDKSIKSLLSEWATRTLVALEAHYNAARYFGKLHYWIGIPAVIFAAIVGTSVFATLKKDVDIYIKITVASFSIIAAILSALQTFLKYNERSEKHRLIGARYADIKREIEQLLTIAEDHLNENKKEINSIRVEIKHISEDAPSLPARFYKAAKEKYK